MFFQPKASKIRTSKHHASVKLPQVASKDANQDLPSFESIRPTEAEVTASEGRQLVIQQSKKAKQMEKREAFLQKLEPSTKQASKSHERRLKRKAKEQLVAGLNELQSALASLEEESGREEVQSTNADTLHAEKTSKPAVKPGIIGKSGSSTLSRAQRKRVL
ncbi:hypothetical protein JR316_0000879 [Psilocybe cubensis]|uniref:Ribosome biogenesis protein SLX9 n=2 Tax=Psilocybe cubensis TaxID=181762 RepID=A0A8H7YAC4_PSICU|nr:hypothetical protein JR316_0000879 [Psilocybe cubensis]KAH9486814.1 hypothetical protein JR316_0000879 [Psilocybe cubensis]